MKEKIGEPGYITNKQESKQTKLLYIRRHKWKGKANPGKTFTTQRWKISIQNIYYKSIKQRQMIQYNDTVVMNKDMT